MAAAPPPPPPPSLISPAAAVGLAAVSIAAYQLIFALVVVALPRRALAARVLSLAPLAVAAWAVNRCAVARAGPPQRQAPLLGLLVIHWLGLAEYVLVSRVDAAKLSELAAGAVVAPDDDAVPSDGAPEKQQQQQQQQQESGKVGMGRQIWQALSLSCNARRLGTEWEVKNVYRRRGLPGSQQQAGGGSSSSSSRMRFLAHVVPRIALCWLVVDALMQAPPPEPHLVAAAKQTPWRLWTLTGEDLGFRAAATVLFWLTAYCVVYILIHVGAVASVALGLSTPAFWPHLFGPLSELCTIRGFWGTFWHQRLRRTLTAFSDVIADRVLLMPRGGLASRYARLFLAFAISGLLHHPTDTVQGLPATETASVAFFLMQPVGILIEDAAQALTRRWPLPRGARAAAGYVWVALFLVCTTPTWMFSIARLGQTPDLLPVKVARPLLAMLTREQTKLAL
ncbi:hypothetical protein V2A60_008137 [Cordyceps javanica]